MQRADYTIFSVGQIGPLSLSNRLVRSATWDPFILRERRVNDPVVALYRRLALGGVGLIITGDFSAVPAGMLKVPGQSGVSHPTRMYGSKALAGWWRQFAPPRPDARSLPR